MATENPIIPKRQIDWEKCCICQKIQSNEKLISPRSHRIQAHDGYTMIATNVPLFKELSAMPLNVDPSCLDEGGGIEVTLRKNAAKYHKNCRLMFNNFKLERTRKRRCNVQIDSDEKSVKRRRTSHDNEACILCNRVNPTPDIRNVMTMNLSQRLKECATTLSDGNLLAKLSGADAIAQGIRYHRKCLTALYNRERDHLKNLEKTSRQSETEPDVYPLVLSELANYMIETSLSSEGPAIFPLADIFNLYLKRLNQLGIDSPSMNKTRLKEKLLMEIPELEAHKMGRSVLLALQKDVALALSQTSAYSDGLVLAKAAKILRRHILNHQSKFDGTFREGCIKDAIPTTLLQFVGMVEHGADIKSQLGLGSSKSDQAIAQLLQYNCLSKEKNISTSHRHSKDRETPFPVYLGMVVYAKTRKRNLIEILHDHGLSIPYKRVLEISAQLGHVTVRKYMEDGVVCPPVLRKGLFTTAVMDNIDHNPSATTATTSFHGTSISVFQHPAPDNHGEEREPVRFGPEKVTSVPELPVSFTNIPQATFNPKNPTPPSGEVPVPAADILRPQMALEYEWLEKVFVTEEVDGAVNVTWSAHHANQKRRPELEVSITSLLPLLRDEAHSVATVKHIMQKVRDTVEHLNPGQVPVITADQPIYAVAKQVQWRWPDEYGEDKYLVMFGGLHIEMAALRSLGSLLKNSGWTGALVEAGVASSGTADSFLAVSNVAKTRQMHQVTACSLYNLLKSAYNSFCTQASSNDDALSFDEWCQKKKQQSPQFHFWHLVLLMELTILMLIRSFREANFSLYCQALRALIPYFFANNNTHYARWLPVHLRDMVTLESKHKALAHEFKMGNFVVHKTKRLFSSMALDQAHEQANAVIKGDGGAIGITENPSALRRWMIAGPEVSHLVSLYEIEAETKVVSDKSLHHEQTPCAQRTFLKRVHKLSQVLQNLGNPFLEDSMDLYSLDTKDVANSSSAELVHTHLQKGLAQYHDFVNRLECNPASFYEPIKRQRLDFFSQNKHVSDSSNQKQLKEDCQLFSKLFISCQTRECDLQEFFQHENQPFPASISDAGNIHSCQKSQLASILENHATPPEQEPEADTIIIDGSAFIHALPPKHSNTFADYAALDFLPRLSAYANKYNTTHVVFDVYSPSSLKADTRSKRGQGGRRKVTDTNTIPADWHNFLRNNDNKSELFYFIAEKIAQISTPNLIIVTKGPQVLSTQKVSLTEINECPHEEADTRIFLHARYAAGQGSKSIIVKANDTDVLVIALSMFPTLQYIGLKQLWLNFSTGGSTRWIGIHSLYNNVGREKAEGMLFFHAFTGCDVVSSFRNKGKKTAWQTWNRFQEATPVFSKLSQHPPTIEKDDMKIIEKFVVLMYDKSSTADCVDEARLDLFARKQRGYEAIPPTKAALIQHTKRAAYQAGCVWSQSILRQPEPESPADWGWEKIGEKWKVLWTTNSPVAKSCEQLTKCGCKAGCSGRCKCFRLGLACTALCSCKCGV